MQRGDAAPRVHSTPGYTPRVHPQETDREGPACAIELRARQCHDEGEDRLRRRVGGDEDQEAREQQTTDALRAFEPVELRLVGFGDKGDVRDR